MPAVQSGVRENFGVKKCRFMNRETRENRQPVFMKAEKIGSTFLENDAK